MISVCSLAKLVNDFSAVSDISSFKIDCTVIDWTTSIRIIKTQGEPIAAFTRYLLFYMCVRSPFKLDWIVLVDSLLFFFCFCILCFVDRCRATTKMMERKCRKNLQFFNVSCIFKNVKVRNCSNQFESFQDISWKVW